MTERKLNLANLHLGFVLLSLPLLAVSAQHMATTPPTSSSVSIPATAPMVDLSMPEPAVRAYAEACRDGDGAKFMATVHAGSQQEEQLARAMARWVVGSTELKIAAAAKFGNAQAAEVASAIPFPSADDRGREMLESLADQSSSHEVLIEGERARVEVEPIGYLALKKVAGTWKISLIEDPALSDAQNITLFNAIATAQETVANAIRRGNYRTGAEAAQALQRELTK